MESAIGGDKVFYTRSTWLRVPVKVVDHSNEGYVELEYHQAGVPMSPVMRAIATLYVGGL